MTQLRFAIFFATVAAFMNGGTILDDFNRADASTLGPNWTQQAGADQVVSNQATAVTSNSLATFNGLSTDTVFASVFSDQSGLQFAALVLDFADVNNSYFIKVQENSAGTGFVNYAFYYGNNGSGTGSGIFQSLSASFTSALIWATVSGNTANLFIDPTFTGVAQQTYSFTYDTSTGGTGAGLGFFGAAAIDDFGTGLPGSTTPEPGTFALMGSAMFGVALLSKRFRKQ